MNSTYNIEDQDLYIEKEFDMINRLVLDENEPCSKKKIKSKAPPIVKIVNTIEIPPPVILQMPNHIESKRFSLPCRFGRDCNNMKCTFAHTENELKIVCCTTHHVNDEYKNCTYYHMRTETIAEYKKRIFSKKREKESARTKMCFYGSQCKKISCTYAHTIDELKIKLCNNFENCTQKYCLFRHQNETEKQVKEKQKEFRKEGLLKALENNSLEYRDDSILCVKYIEGQLDQFWTLENVIKRLNQIKWLYGYTEFKQFYGKNKHRLTFAEAENEMLKQYPYPPLMKWPWLN